MAFSCCFRLGGNLDFRDFLQKSFITSTPGLHCLWSCPQVLLQINGENVVVENTNNIELKSMRDAESKSPLVATVSAASPGVVSVTAPPPSLTVNESRRKKEDNMAVIFMGFILVRFLKNGPTPASFCLFLFFSNSILQKIVDIRGIRTQTVGVKGVHADHLTTTTAQ